MITDELRERVRNAREIIVYPQEQKPLGDSVEVSGADLPHLILAWRQAHPMRVCKPFPRHITADEVCYMVIDEAVLGV